jgi:hypothetical protein
MLFKEMIDVYTDDHTKPMNTLWAKCSYWLLKQVVHMVATGLADGKVACHKVASVTSRAQVGGR